MSVNVGTVVTTVHESVLDLVYKAIVVGVINEPVLKERAVEVFFIGKIHALVVVLGVIVSKGRDQKGIWEVLRYLLGNCCLSLLE